MKSNYTLQDIMAIVLFLVSVFLLASGLFMDTTLTVVYPNGNSYGLPDRVENIHLANEKQNYLIFGVVIFVLSIFLMITSSHKKKCPKCAELIKYEAKVCKHCKTEFTNEIKEEIPEDDNYEVSEDDEIEIMRKNLTNGFFNK